MPTNVATHTFMKGMISDTGINLKNNESYDYAENLRHTNDYTDTLGALTNFKGFELVSSDGFSTYQVPVAHTTIRDKMYMLCTTNGLGAAYDAIYRFDVNSIAKTLTNWVRLWEGTSGSLGLSITKNTDIVGIYEASDNIKIYWTTDAQPLKVANVSTYITNDGTGSGTYIDAERFNMITSSTATNLVYNGLTSGTLDSGRVQYAYNLLKDKLQETMLSPITGMINLYSDPVSVNSASVKGDYETVDTGKGVILSITLDSDDVTYYDKLRLYRVHYTDYNQIPQITIVGDYSVATAMTLIDSGSVGLGELTVEEFAILTGLYSGTTLDTKDNRLLVGNVEEIPFDLDFDARVYRFRRPYSPNVTGDITSIDDVSGDIHLTILFPEGLRELSTATTIPLKIGINTHPIAQNYPIISKTGNLTYIFEQIFYGSFIYRGNWSGGTTYDAGDIVRGNNGSGVYNLYLAIESSTGVAVTDTDYWTPWISVGDDAVTSIIPTTDIVCNLYSAYGTYTSPQHTFNASTLDYPNTTTEVEYNCINPYNDISKDYNPDYQYIYTSSGSVIGAEGPEITLSFTTGSNLYLDDAATTSSAKTFGSSTDYSNPNISLTYTGYQRGEIYRFGIVFYNSIGQKSKVKWIGDIRFPSWETLQNIAYDNTTTISMVPITVGITLKDGVLPTGAVSWELVRVKRTVNDRSIVATGYGSRVHNNSVGTPYATSLGVPLFDSSIFTYGAGETTNDRLLTFVSAEEAFQGTSSIVDSDYVDIVGGLGTYNTYTYSTSAYPDLYQNRESAIKYRSCSLYSDYHSCQRFSLDQHKYILQSGDITGLGFYFNQANTTNNFTLSILHYFSLSGSYTFYSSNDNGRKNILGFNSDIVESNFTSVYTNDFSVPYLYVKRLNYEKYGGSSYSARENNEYISCGEITSDVTEVFYGGDTYINYFDYVNSILRDEYTDANTKTSVKVIFPTESTINISLRSDNTYSSGEYLNPASYKMQEYAGVWGTGTEYTQETDLYMYNPIYSQEQNIKYDYALNNLDLNTIFDSRIIYSDKKIYDESVDSWLKFRPNNFLDVDSKYGQIEVIRNFRNEIYFLQERGFGVAPVNERSLLNDNNPGALSLGVANVLSRYAYLSTEYGCKDMLSVLNTNSALYWTDRNKKTILKFDGSSLGDLTKVKGNKKLVRDLMGTNSTITPFTYITIHNPDYNETLFRLSDTKILVFNEYFDVFSGVMTTTNTYLLATNNVNATFINTNLYIHDKTNNYNEFISGTSLTHMNSLLRFTNSDQLPLTKVYDNLCFFTYAKDSNGYIVNNSTFSIVSFKNDYQYTICTNTAGSNVLTLNDNLQRKERGYSTYIPRNIVNANGTTNIDITNPVNQSSIRTYKERMRDKYLTTDLTYVNSDYLFVIPEVQITYRYSKPNIQ